MNMKLYLLVQLFVVMVLPIYKVLSLVIRVFSKPLVTYTKQIHLKNDSNNLNPFLRRTFINLGNAYNKGQTWVNRKFMNIESQFAYKPLNDQLAIQKGIQFFYQIVFYSLVIGLPLYQMVRASNQARVKSQRLDQKLRRIDGQLEEILVRERQLDREEASTQTEIQQNPSQPTPTPTTITKSITPTLNLIPLKLPPNDTKIHSYRISFLPNPQPQPPIPQTPP